MSYKPNHSVGRPSRSAKAQLRDLAEHYGATNLHGKPLSRLNMNELRETIALAKSSDAASPRERTQ